MNREDAENVLDCAMSIGEQLLISGAEVGRVEDTIRRICSAYGAARVDVFSITSSIITTMYGEPFGSCTETRRVSSTQSDLSRLDRLNQLSRNICSELPPPAEIRAALTQIEAGPRFSFRQMLLIYALISGSFALFFGGDWSDMLVSAAIGILLKGLESLIGKGSVNALFRALTCSVAGGFLANLAVCAGLGHHVDMISIGNVMLFIPGIAFTNSLRDLFSGDTITGLIRFCESILTAIIVALGFTVANFIF